jgi:hypothetical protein
MIHFLNPSRGFRDGIEIRDSGLQSFPTEDVGQWHDDWPFINSHQRCQSDSQNLPPRSWELTLPELVHGYISEVKIHRPASGPLARPCHHDVCQMVSPSAELRRCPFLLMSTKPETSQHLARAHSISDRISLTDDENEHHRKTRGPGFRDSS